MVESDNFESLFAEIKELRGDLVELNQMIPDFKRKSNINYLNKREKELEA